MKLNSTISERLAVLRFPLIVGVVLMHSFSSVVSFSSKSTGVQEPGLISYAIRQYISEVLACVSVPLFYTISGFLFFFGYQFSKKVVLDKLSRRFKTLFIPFISWNLLVLSALALAQSIPSLATFFSGNYYGFIRNFSLFDYANALFGIDGAPIAFQFWFIRDLILLVLFSPLIFIAIRGLGVFLLGLLFLLWVTNIWPITIPSSEATFFFCFGCYLGTNESNLSLADKYFKPVLLIYIIFSLVDLITYSYQYHYSIHRVGILFGVVAAFCATQYISEWERLKKMMVTLGSASFFVFAAHQPFLMVLKKIIYKLLSPNNDFLVLFLYFAIPIVVIIVCLYSHKYLTRFMPVISSILTGGRVQPSERVVGSGSGK